MTHLHGQGQIKKKMCSIHVNIKFAILNNFKCQFSGIKYIHTAVQIAPLSISKILSLTKTDFENTQKNCREQNHHRLHFGMIVPKESYKVCKK